MVAHYRSTRYATMQHWTVEHVCFWYVFKTDQSLFVLAVISKVCSCVWTLLSSVQSGVEQIEAFLIHMIINLFRLIYTTLAQQESSM